MKNVEPEETGNGENNHPPIEDAIAGKISSLDFAKPSTISQEYVTLTLFDLSIRPFLEGTNS